MSGDVFMDVPAVLALAQELRAAGERAENAQQRLDAVAQLLHSHALAGAPGNAARGRYVERIAPRLQALAERCAELARDLEDGARAFERGDATGTTRFY